MNTRIKGRNAELELKKMLEEAGWEVCIVQNPKKYNKENDFFGLFDLLAVKGKQHKYIQVKCNRKPPFKKYREWGEAHGIPGHETVEVWVRKDREGWHAHIVWDGLEER